MARHVCRAPTSGEVFAESLAKVEVESAASASNETIGNSFFIKIPAVSLLAP
jgi:hypothetical protein